MATFHYFSVADCLAWKVDSFSSVEHLKVVVKCSFCFSGGGGNFVLSTSCIGYTTVFGGVAPMCPHGYGVFYRIGDDK